MSSGASTHRTLLVGRGTAGAKAADSIGSEQHPGGPQCGGTVLETGMQTGSQFMERNNIDIELSLKVY